MKTTRIFTFAAVMVGAFYYLSTHHRAFTGMPLSQAISRPTHVALTEAAAPPQFDADEQTNINIYKKVLPSVVNITSRTVQFDFFYGEVPEEGLGSGFIIDRQGHILTNFHVVANARQVEVTL